MHVGGHHNSKVLKLVEVHFKIGRALFLNKNTSPACGLTGIRILVDVILSFDLYWIQIQIGHLDPN